MLPTGVTAESFRAYPEQARRSPPSSLRCSVVAAGILPLLLRELIVFDWKFPAERRDLQRQFAIWEACPSDGLLRAMASFAQLRLLAGTGACRLGRLSRGVFRATDRASLGHAPDRWLPRGCCRVCGEDIRTFASAADASSGNRCHRARQPRRVISVIPKACTTRLAVRECGWDGWSEGIGSGGVAARRGASRALRALVHRRCGRSCARRWCEPCVVMPGWPRRAHRCRLVCRRRTKAACSIPRRFAA